MSIEKNEMKKLNFTDQSDYYQPEILLDQFNLDFTAKENNQKQLQTENHQKSPSIKQVQQSSLKQFPQRLQEQFIEPIQQQQPTQNLQIFDPNFTAFFLFVNPNSGGNRASVYMQLNVQHILFSFEPKIADVYFINLKKAENRLYGLSTLKEYQDKGIHVRAIVCGGDGTVMWVVTELVKAKIKIDSCPIGIIPFGTGNDFSRVLHWGPTAPSSLIGPYMRDFKKQVNSWLYSTICDYDIWDVSVILQDQGGQFLRIDKQQNGGWKKVVMQDKQISKHLCNYFSFGVDSRIGLGFDKHRTQSVCGNKCVYCWEGFKKMFIKTSKIKDIVEKFYVPKDENNISQIKRIIFDQENQIIGDPVTIFCLNINSFSGGVMDTWKNCEKKIAVRYPEDFGPQNFGDGKIEFVSFNSISGIANERFIAGQASRVEQGGGPYVIEFKRSTGNPIRTYFQVDGEFFQVIYNFIFNYVPIQIMNPKYILINKTSLLPQKKIKVQVNSLTK